MLAYRVTVGGQRDKMAFLIEPELGRVSSRKSSCKCSIVCERDLMYHELLVEPQIQCRVGVRYIEKVTFFCIDSILDENRNEVPKFEGTLLFISFVISKAALERRLGTWKDLNGLYTSGVARKSFYVGRTGSDCAVEQHTFAWKGREDFFIA